MRWLLVFLLLALPGSAQTLNVFAAASLNEVFQELGTAFEHAHPGVHVRLNFDGSQNLVRQMAQGAPADVFASADSLQMEQAVQQGSVSEGAAQVFARNRLVIVVPADNPAHIAALKDLARPKLKLVIADKKVPIGSYTLKMLQASHQASFRQAVLANVVSYETTVRAVLNKVALGECDAGIVYLTDAKATSKVQVLPVPPNVNQTATYPLAVTIHAAQKQLARQFVDFVLSSGSQRILTRAGFLPGR